MGEGSELADSLRAFLERAPELDAAGHRVVHGGAEFSSPVILDDHVYERLQDLSDLAPLHNPPALAAIRALRELRPELRSVACFDTEFHAGLPAVAATYAIPREWSARWPLRRYGFQGLSHAYASRRAGELVGREEGNLRIVTAHLGGGASLAAVSSGRSVDTTMGFTPLEGLVMSTRSGSVDPGLLMWVQRRGGMSADEMESALDCHAGIAALSGGSGDMREVLDGVESGDERCRLALDVFVRSVAQGVAAMATSMRGIDVLAFTGGIGEKAPLVRDQVCAALAFLGIALEEDANAAAEADAVVSPRDHGVAVVVITAREDIEIARKVRLLTAARPAR